MEVFPAENGMLVGNPPSLIFGGESLPMVVPAQVWEPAGFVNLRTVFVGSVGSTTVGVELTAPPKEVVVKSGPPASQVTGSASCEYPDNEIRNSARDKSFFIN
jgi:hypothetical protein